MAESYTNQRIFSRLTAGRKKDQMRMQDQGDVSNDDENSMELDLEREK